MVLPTSPAGLVLTPGASADRDHSTLVAIEAALELPVLRLTLGTTSVPKAVGTIIEAVENFANELGVETSDLVIGGRSFGGRSCSVAAASGLAVAGLLLLSYPLHPPGKPEKLRVDHFGEISVPTLFISGEKDPFGRPDEFEAHIGAFLDPPSCNGLVVGTRRKGYKKQLSSNACIPPSHPDLTERHVARQ